MDNKEIALELTKILTNTINAACSAIDSVENNSLVVLGYYETILKKLEEHDERNPK